MQLPEPTPEEHLVLINSPEARAQRRAQRIGQRSLASISHKRGRRRPDISSPDQLALHERTVLDVSVVAELGRTLAEKHPLLDQFTKHYLVHPTKDSLERYVMASGGKMKLDPELNLTPKQIKNKKIRQTNHVLDLLQEGSHDDLNIARRRRASLRTTQFLAATGRPLDETSARFAAEAIQDFGHGLTANREILQEVHDEGLGEAIAFIGERAADDSSVLLENEDLMRLTQIEQAARVDFWQPVYAASKRFYGNRLTRQHTEDDFALKDELARLDALCQA